MPPDQDQKVPKVGMKRFRQANPICAHALASPRHTSRLGRSGLLIELGHGAFDAS
jgi:hypothetical protein